MRLNALHRFSGSCPPGLAVRRVPLLISAEGGVDITSLEVGFSSLSIGTGIAKKLCACTQDLSRREQVLGGFLLTQAVCSLERPRLLL